MDCTDEEEFCDWLTNVMETCMANGCTSEADQLLTIRDGLDADGKRELAMLKGEDGGQLTSWEVLRYFQERFYRLNQHLSGKGWARFFNMDLFVCLFVCLFYCCGQSYKPHHETSPAPDRSP